MPGGRNALDAQPVAVDIRVVVEHGDLDGLVLRSRGPVVGGFGRIVDRGHGDLDRRGVGEAARVRDDIGEAVGAVVVRVRDVRDACSVRCNLRRAMPGGRNTLDSQPVTVDVHVVVEHGDLDRFFFQGGGPVVGSFGCIVDRSHGDLDRRGVGEAARVGDDVGEAVGAVVVRVRRILDGRSSVHNQRLPVFWCADRDHANPVSTIGILIVGQDLRPRLLVLGHAQRVVRGRRAFVHIDHMHHDLLPRFAAQRVSRDYGQRIAVRIDFEVLPGADVAQIPRRRIDDKSVAARHQPKLDIVSIGIGHGNAAERRWCPAAVAVLGNLETRRRSEHRGTVHDFHHHFRSRLPTLPVGNFNPDDDGADAVRCRPPRIRLIGRSRERSPRGAPVV